MKEQEEIRRKLTELAAHKDAYDAANAAMVACDNPKRPYSVLASFGGCTRGIYARLELVRCTRYTAYVEP